MPCDFLITNTWVGGQKIYSWNYQQRLWRIIYIYIYTVYMNKYYKTLILIMLSDFLYDSRLCQKCDQFISLVLQLDDFITWWWSYWQVLHMFGTEHRPSLGRHLNSGWDGKCQACSFCDLWFMNHDPFTKMHVKHNCVFTRTHIFHKLIFPTCTTMCISEHASTHFSALQWPLKAFLSCQTF